MKKMKTNVLLVIILILSSGLGAQELTSETRSSVNVEQLPEYIVVTSENTKLLEELTFQLITKNLSMLMF